MRLNGKRNLAPFVASYSAKGLNQRVTFMDAFETIPEDLSSAHDILSHINDVRTSQSISGDVQVRKSTAVRQRADRVSVSECVLREVERM